MKPCIYCDLLIAKDVFEEEAGMCLDCSNAFYDHKIDPYDQDTFPKNKKQDV